MARPAITRGETLSEEIVMSASLERRVAVDGTEIAFDKDYRSAWLEAATGAEPGSLPIGVCGMSADFTVGQVNPVEPKISGPTQECFTVRNLFTSLAPCRHNLRVAHR
jgi:hypothetical protein